MWHVAYPSSVNAELSTLTDQLLHPKNKPESLEKAPCRFRVGGHWTIQCNAEQSGRQDKIDGAMGDGRWAMGDGR
ncbi:uncharacterized protein EAE97_005812 [Botrytis byssoidea]|uniref:Uncharacterized protein n=1 Tax=Botrytis byssoidea TaxID=139641 RepID=A0A9P5IQ31_9HELO|nr:uncharacterized protein EAE97_005812 [Botrytis byssoidea]KAF7943742.1 hypothetical protein EAE97_005812 [Botrytis byssoidea]